MVLITRTIRKFKKSLRSCTYNFFSQSLSWHSLCPEIARASFLRTVHCPHRPCSNRRDVTNPASSRGLPIPTLLGMLSNGRCTIPMCNVSNTAGSVPTIPHARSGPMIMMPKSGIYFAGEYSKFSNRRLCFPVFGQMRNERGHVGEFGNVEIIVHGAFESKLDIGSNLPIER